MDDRTRIDIQSWILADKFNITQVGVHSIIKSYLSYCKELLVHGEQVDFLGLVSIVPNVKANNYNTTLAYNCEKVADRLGMPYHTVYSVMNAYIQEAIECVQRGTTVELRGVAVVSPIFENGKVTKVHSSISQSLKNILVENDTNVTSLRVHTYKSLRDKLSCS
jgi:hypothetical protein